MTEVSWVRSVYLYGMCAVSVALIGLGAVAAAVGLVHTVAPDLGHRDTLDRVGIGLANIGTNVVDLFNEVDLEGIESYCEDVTDNEDDFDDCVEDEQTVSDGGMDSIRDGIAEVKDELRSQIRNNSIDGMIRGVLMIAAGVVLFRIHGRRTELFADGLMPAKPVPATADPPAIPPPPAAPMPLDPPPT